MNALPGCVEDWTQWERVKYYYKLLSTQILTIESNSIIIIVFYVMIWQNSRTKVWGKKAMISKHLNGTGTTSIANTSSNWEPNSQSRKSYYK